MLNSLAHPLEPWARTKGVNLGEELTNLPPEGGYAPDNALEFMHNGSAHFCHWGKRVSQDVTQIQEVVQIYQPEYLLVELGFNDLAWKSVSPEALLRQRHRDSQPCPCR